MGMLRLFLALCVIAGHCGTTILKFNGIGSFYAVNFFFIISGFYMAMVLNEKYAETKALDFYTSRILRLFPIYYVGLALSLFVSFAAISKFFGTLPLGSKIFFIFQNIFIVGQDLSYLVCTKTAAQGCADPVSLTINPPAWSLAVELGFYLVAPFILKSQKKTFAFVMVGCAYFLCINHLRYPLDTNIGFRAAEFSGFNYYFYPASFAFFGGGALAYHMSKSSSAPHYWAAVAAIALFSYTQSVMPAWHLLFISLAIPTLFNYTKNNRIDRLIGELSYPAYILHFPVLLLVGPLLQSHPEYSKVLSYGTLVALISISIGLLLHFAIEQQINRYRQSLTFLRGASEVGKGARRDSRPFRLAAALYLLLPFATVGYVYGSQHKLPAKETITPHNFTDVNWVNGVGRAFSGFFVPNSPQNLARFAVGMKLRLSNGEVRQVTDITRSAEYINVYLSGLPMNGTEVGYPKEIEVVK